MLRLCLPIRHRGLPLMEGTFLVRVPIDCAHASYASESLRAKSIVKTAESLCARIIKKLCWQEVAPIALMNFNLPYCVACLVNGIQGLSRR